MNANEFIDGYGKALEGDGEIDLVETYAILRQQALEIQALHQILGYEGIEVGKEYLDECVADLRKAQEK